MAYIDVAPTFAAEIPETEFQGDRVERRRKVREQTPQGYKPLNSARIRKIFRAFRQGLSNDMIFHDVGVDPHTIRTLKQEYDATEAYFNDLEKEPV